LIDEGDLQHEQSACRFRPEVTVRAALDPQGGRLDLDALIDERLAPPGSAQRARDRPEALAIKNEKE
jgi:hypothetical protein